MVKKNLIRILILVVAGAALGAVIGFISGTYNLPMGVVIGVTASLVVVGFFVIMGRRSPKQ